MAKAKLETKDEFKPVEITCTLETQGELNAFTAAFNYMPIYSAQGVPYAWCKCIREVGKAAGGSSDVKIINK